jgi:hypothetical protein
VSEKSEELLTTKNFSTVHRKTFLNMGEKIVLSSNSMRKNFTKQNLDWRGMAPCAYYVSIHQAQIFKHRQFSFLVESTVSFFYEGGRNVELMSGLQ